MQPDPDTNVRLQFLAQVGDALLEGENETAQQTNLFAAKEALNKFATELGKLTLTPEVRDGMEKLITYLNQKIDRRLNNSMQYGDNE